MTATWHVDDEALDRWVSGTDTAWSGASVEQHLMRCEECRARVPRPEITDRVWTDIRDRVELPRPSYIERLLLLLGFSTADARVVAVSPAFRAAWGSGLVVLLSFATFAAMWGDNRGQILFLVVAPLVPAIGVALGYEPEVEPSLEQECATPASRSRLVLLRSLVLVASALPVLLVAAALVPGPLSAVWLAPAAALTLAVLAASTWVTPFTATAAFGAVWVVVVATVGPAPVDVLTGQFLAVTVVVAAVAAAVLVVRRHQLGELPGSAR